MSFEAYKDTDWSCEYSNWKFICSLYYQ